MTEIELSEFELYVKTNMKRAYFSALGFVGTHDDAMEISQRAFINAYKHFDKFDSSRNFFTWYYKILKNLCLNFLRDSKSRKEVSFIEFEDELTAENQSDQFERKEQVTILEAALSRLSTNDREIIILKEFQNFSYKEIAETLEIPIGSVMSKLFYARKKLSEILKELQ